MWAAATGSLEQNRCAVLASLDLTGLEDAPTQITEARTVAAAAGLPAYCRVQAYVQPQVGLELWLPNSGWNGKLLVLGSRGLGGFLSTDGCAPQLMRGYACLGFDTGHKGGGAEALWAHNNLPAQVDFGYRSAHVVALAGKALVARYYAKAPQRSYFMGCSTGGYEALVEAQRFPWDFQGLIAGAPDMDEAQWALRAAWNARQFLDPAGQPILSAQDLALLHDAVLHKCARDEVDGMVANPVGCAFDPASLSCRAGTSSACLSAGKVEAIERLYRGPSTSAGVPLASRGILPGSEAGWDDPMLGLAAAAATANALFKHAIYGLTAGLTADNFDFDHDSQRLGLGALYSTNPDLRRFKAAGGKLLAFQGASDVLQVPGAILDYYETAEKIVGGRTPTQAFFRLFLVPGMNHCTAGAGAYAIDYLHYLEAWVERGAPPEALIGAHLSDRYLLSQPSPWDQPGMTASAKLFIRTFELTFPLDPKMPIEFTRPIFPYPKYARYKGAGDPRRAESFESAEP